MRKTITSHSYFKIVRCAGSWLLLMLLAVTAQGQTTYTLRGTVTADDNEPLPGATVQVKNTTMGTVTDASGNYAFQANLQPGSYVLVIRSLGLLTEEIPLVLGTQTEVVNDVGLTADVLSLDEIVVTGSTVTSSRRELGNAISTVKSEELTRATPQTMLSGLQGKNSRCTDHAKFR